MPNNLNFQMPPLLTCVGVLITDVADIDPNFVCEGSTTYLDFLDHAQKSNNTIAVLKSCLVREYVNYHQMCSCQQMCMLAESFKIIAVTISMPLFSPHPEAVL